MKHLQSATFKSLPYISCFLLLAGLMLFFTSPAQAQRASYSNGLLILPVVVVGDNFYREELTSVPGSQPIEFTLTAATQISGPGDEFNSIFDGSSVLIPSLDVNDAIYWAQLSRVGSNPFLFRLAAAAIDDNDDDNDGIDDEDDVFPYIVNDANDPQALNGAWLLFFKVDQVSGDCDGETGTFTEENAFFTYDIDTGTYFLQGVVSSEVAVTNKMFTYSGTFPDDGGTTTRQEMTMTIHPDTLDYEYMTMTGEEMWSWTDGTFSCTGGVSSVWGTRNLFQDSLPEGVLD